MDITVKTATIKEKSVLPAADKIMRFGRQLGIDNSSGGYWPCYRYESENYVLIDYFDEKTGRIKGYHVHKYYRRIGELLNIGPDVCHKCNKYVFNECKCYQNREPFQRKVS